jgi:FkbM family methyltransferase
MRKVYAYLKRISKPKYKKSYAQSGEDLILNLLFSKVKHGFYVDVGANDPFFQSNTHFFYKKGWRGLNIDANAKSIKKLSRFRKRDLNVEALVSNRDEEIQYYYYEKSAYNGCVFREDIPSKLLNSKKIKSISLTALILRWNIKDINFLSIDVEGLDLEVLESLDLANIRPQAIIIESFSSDLTNDIDSDISKHLQNFDYRYFCRTVTNTIYLSKEFHFSRFGGNKTTAN